MCALCFRRERGRERRRKEKDNDKKSERNIDIHNHGYKPGHFPREGGVLEKYP